MDLPLFQAAIAGDAGFFRSLARTNLSYLISQRTIDGNSVLHLAATFGHVELSVAILCNAQLAVAFLIESPCNSRGSTPLHCAAAAGHSELLYRLIEHEHGRRLLLLGNHAGDTALHEATRNDHSSVVELLMSAAPQLASINNNWGVSALYMAAERVSLGIVCSLLGSEVASHDGPRGQTALHAAVLRSYDITKMITEKKPTSVNHADSNKSTPLHFAATTGDVRMVKLLLVCDASVAYAQDEHGLSALHVASSQGHVGVVEQLIMHRPDAREQRNGKGRNLLHLAAEKKQLKVVKYALRSPLLVGLVNESDDEGNTPLHLAVLSRNIEIIHALTSHGRTNTNLMNRNGYTPLDLASSNVKSILGLRTYNIMANLISRGSRPSPQRYDLIATHKEVRNEEGEINRYRALCNNLAIIAVLVATVTFAAAFTLPGGYNSNDQGSSRPGMATLAKRAAFKVFLISDTLAMTSSITVTSLLIYSASIDHDVRLHNLHIVMKLMEFAVCALLIAFAAGIYVTVAHECLWVSILVCLIVSSVPFGRYAVTYCTSATYVGMRMVIKNLVSGKGLKWLGSTESEVLPSGDEAREGSQAAGRSDTCIVAAEEMARTEHSTLHRHVMSFLMRHMPQDMNFVSPANSKNEGNRRTTMKS